MYIAGIPLEVSILAFILIAIGAIIGFAFERQTTPQIKGRWTRGLTEDVRRAVGSRSGIAITRVDRRTIMLTFPGEMGE